jgi:hypothetical protein
MDDGLVVKFGGYLKARASLYAQSLIWVNMKLNHCDFT